MARNVAAAFMRDKISVTAVSYFRLLLYIQRNLICTVSVGFIFAIISSVQTSAGKRF